jgi:serine/threonine-protein kinase
MGTVYAAEHMLLRKRVALKVLHPDMSRNPEMVARFEREAMAAGHIAHPNIAAATDFGRLDDGSFFLVLELVEGESLREALSGGRLDVDRAVHVAGQIASALSRAHGLGVVHRDLKPENVMLVRRAADPDFVKVLDFGIAKGAVLDGPPSTNAPTVGGSRALTRVGMVYGTPGYMAPEQALAQPVDARADLYAVGVLLFEMLAGKRPFESANVAVLLGLHVSAAVPAIGDAAPGVEVPPALEAIVRRLLAKEPADRFASASDLEGALAELRPGRAEPREDGGASRLAARARGAIQHHRRLAVLLAVVGAITVAFVSLPRTRAVVTSAEPPLHLDPVADDPLAPVIAAAEDALAKRDPAGAIAAVAPVEADNEGRADIHRLLERAYAMSHDRGSALGEAGRWLAADPRAFRDLALQADIGEIATHPELSPAATSLLASRMSAPGVDIVYDLAYTSRQAPPVARGARAALADPAVRAHAGPAAAILLDLRAATTCDEIRALLPRAQTDGDRRAVGLLQALASGNPAACPRGDPALGEAIAAVRSRTGTP